MPLARYGTCQKDETLNNTVQFVDNHYSVGLL